MLARTPVLIFALGIATATLAQQQPPSATEIDGRLQWLASQRDEASNHAVMLAGRLNDTLAKLKAASEEVQRLKTLCGEPCKEKPAEKSKER